MNDDMELLREYAVGQSEPAFETLAARHVGLVHSAALRQVADPHLAEEITQTVFIILARKAGSLNPKTILPGWLYRTTRYVTFAALKMQRRRERHEQAADTETMAEDAPTGPAWEELMPLLDQAMAQLREKDRDAIVLRYFQNKSLRDVGAALGLDEYAAQKRVGRAVEKLRNIFVKHGVASEGGTLTEMISANSIQAAPAALAKTVCALALGKGEAVTSSTLVFANMVLKLIAWSKAKTVMAIAVVILLMAGVGQTILEEQRIWDEKTSIYAQLSTGNLPPDWQRRLEGQYEALRQEESQMRAHNPLARLFPKVFPATAARYEVFSLQLSPYSTVGFASGKAMVIYDGMGYELAAVNDLPTPDILNFCRRQYGTLWDVRFAEDLADVLTDMKHPIGADHTVSVTLVNPRTGERRVIEQVPVTKENRRYIFETLHPETNQLHP